MMSRCKTWIAIVALAGLLLASGAQANSFTVHGGEWGSGHVDLLRGGVVESVHAALLDVDLEGYGHGHSFCVDLDHSIGSGDYIARVLDPAVASALGMNYGAAAAIANRWTHDLDSLPGTRADAISAVQAAIWDVLYGDALSIMGFGNKRARHAYDRVMAEQYAGYGDTELDDFESNQDQIFTPGIPEPSAALVFALGGLLVGRSTSSRRR